MAVETGGGVTLSKMYERAMKLLLRAREGLERLETLEHSTAAIDSPDLSLLIKNDIFQVQSLCAEMDHLCRSVTSTSQRDFPHLWKRKVEQVVEGAAFLNEGLDNYNLRNEKRIMEAREREELLGRANEESSDHILRILDEEAQAMQSVRSSSRMLEEACATGEAILFKYSDQREILKRAQRNALDIRNTVGLSNSLLKLIERRQRADQWIKYAGMILTVIIVFFCWRWTR